MSRLVWIKPTCHDRVSGSSQHDPITAMQGNGKRKRLFECCERSNCVQTIRGPRWTLLATIRWCLPYQACAMADGGGLPVRARPGKRIEENDEESDKRRGGGSPRSCDLLLVIARIVWRINRGSRRSSRHESCMPVEEK